VCSARSPCRPAWLRGEPARTTRILREWRGISGIVWRTRSPTGPGSPGAPRRAGGGCSGLRRARPGSHRARPCLVPRRPRRIRPDEGPGVAGGRIAESDKPGTVAWVERDSRVTVIRHACGCVADRDGYRRAGRVVKKARTEIAAGQDAVLTWLSSTSLPRSRLRPTANRAISEFWARRHGSWPVMRARAACCSATEISRSQPLRLGAGGSSFRARWSPACLGAPRGRNWRTGGRHQSRRIPRASLCRAIHFGGQPRALAARGAALLLAAVSAGGPTWGCTMTPALPFGAHRGDAWFAGGVLRMGSAVSEGTNVPCRWRFGRPVRRSK
jgi:hypothetical protein